MGLQLLHMFFLLDPTDPALQEFEAGLISDIRTGFVKKLNLTEVAVEGKSEEKPDWKFIFSAIQKDTNDESGKPPSWIELKKNKKDKYFELNAHIRDGRPEDYPRYSKVFYENDVSPHLEHFSFNMDICPISVRLTYDMNVEKHQVFFNDVENLIRFAYKIQFYVQEGKKENERIDQISREYLLSEKKELNSQPSSKDKEGMLEKDLNDLNDVFEKISFSVNRLFSIKNHLSLDLMNVRNIQSKIREEFNESVEIKYLENKANEIDFKTRDSQVFLALIRDRKDITLGKVKIEGNKQLINYNRDLLKIHQDAAVVESAAIVITFITLFQVLIQCVSAVIPNYIETNLIFKIGIPFFMSLGAISLVECIKEIWAIREDNGRKKSITEILSGERRIKILVLGLFVPLVCLVIIFYIWNWFIGNSIIL